MKKSGVFFLSATRILVAALLGLAALQLQAAAIVSLKGSTQQVRAGEGLVRLSVLGYNDADSTRSFIDHYRNYLEQGDAAAFSKTLRDEQTRGYVFTDEATGYTIKYAWQDPADSAHQVFVVTPALKSLNPYLWRERNDSSDPFSVLELRGEGESFTLKTSLDSAVEISSDGGVLQLQDFDAAAPFATLKDDRPYYLRQSS
jgi:hypothetical protein